MPTDLHATRQAILEGHTSAPAELERALSIAQSPAARHVFLELTPASARAAAAGADARTQPLAGLAVSVKDLFDVSGQVTAAGSLALTGAAPAAADCPAVARLRAAGGALIGRSNMVEFAFSGVGINPHHGTPAAWDARSGAPAALPGDDGPRVPGGSSSGGAVSVALGAAHVALGSDTGGSIRIPAALNGIVGFKNTARLVPATGAIPLSTTLDTVCAMTRSVRDAILVHELLAQRKVARRTAPRSALRLAVAHTLMLDQLDAGVSAAFARSVQVLREASVQVDDIALDALGDLGPINATGGFSPAESFAWHRHLIGREGSRYDPRVLARIQRGAGMSAADYIDLLHARAAWIERMGQALKGFDAVLSPTVPIVAPLLSGVAPGAARDAEFFRVNGLLLRNTAAVNMLDGCAISLPCHITGELPVGLMAWHGALSDDNVLGVALEIEALLQKQ
ncbi:MAG: amidase [Burkholderiaceae bacterium]|nr:amidase [Burkholderiaceae bacterium]MDO9090344.1 amidase [Burkholderiaceae bacterium]